MSEHPISQLMETTIQKVKELANSETVIGKPIEIGENTVIIPVSKLSLGFASGGSDFPSKNPKDLFGGGGGAGITVTPKAFLVVENGNVRLLQLAKDGETVDRLVNMIPDAVNQISSLIKKDKEQE
ncbi:MAG: sporulation protein YtfJ [Ruminococcaceae bacterium]|nr:sporulation protein YtfJ [Oscillospiraceae bacterium]